MNYRSQPVSSEELRRLFNEQRIYECVQSGHFRTVLVKSAHPTSPRAPNCPVCTHSQMVDCYDQFNRKVAQVHQYLRPDGTLGASGRPDPKEVRIGDCLYVLNPDER